MRFLILILALLSIGLVSIAISSGAAPGTDCTRVGTPRGDVLAGGRDPDVICALGGKDYLAGNGGNDILRGGNGPDVLVGGEGRDEVFGKKGRDRLFLVDGNGGSLADGGPGHDDCFVDRGDRVRNCEDVFRGPSMPLAEGLSGSFFGALVLAEELIAEPVPPPPPPSPRSRRSS